MAQDNGYTVLQQPIGVRIIRIFQFIVAVVAVGLAGYAANVFDPYGTDDGLACLGLTIFTVSSSVKVISILPTNANLTGCCNLDYNRVHQNQRIVLQQSLQLLGCPWL